LKTRKAREEDLIRKNTHAIRFNNRELKAIDAYCQRYKVNNKSRFMREAIITEVLKRFDQDHPTLFELDKPNLFAR